MCLYMADPTKRLLSFTKNRNMKACKCGERSHAEGSDGIKMRIDEVVAHSTCDSSRNKMDRSAGFGGFECLADERPILLRFERQHSKGN